MKIKCVTISGFRSIRDEISIDFSSLTALIGPNNTGKSNILAAIHKVLGYSWLTVSNFAENDVWGRKEGGEIEIKIEFDPAIQYQPFKGAAVEIPVLQYKYTTYKRGPEKGQRRLQKSCLKQDGSMVLAPRTAPQRGVRTAFTPLATIPQDVQSSIPVILIAANRSLRDQLPGARYSLLGRLLEDVNESLKKDTSIYRDEEQGTMAELSRYDLFKHRLAQALDLLRTEDFVKLEASIKTNALRQLGFDLERNAGELDIFFTPMDSEDFYQKLKITVSEPGLQLDATDLGGGFQNAIVMAILKTYEERNRQGAIFLIEEPELYLHPQMQRSLYKTLKAISETNQVIYVTHCANFVTIPEFDNIRMVEKGPSGTFVNKSDLASTPQLREKLRKEMDPERSELFFASKILFVEGDTEKLSIPVYALKSSIDLDSRNTSIVEVGGKRNLKDLVELALSFGKRVGILYDRDSSDFEGRRDEEEAYNMMLDSLGARGVFVARMDKNCEDEHRREIGDAPYQQLCQRYPNVTKSVRARLIAVDPAVPVPQFLSGILEWLGQ
jgi:predicted ATP-dependent endonuclease of OLD family